MRQSSSVCTPNKHAHGHLPTRFSVVNSVTPRVVLINNIQRKKTLYHFWNILLEPFSLWNCFPLFSFLVWYLGLCCIKDTFTIPSRALVWFPQSALINRNRGKRPPRFSTWCSQNSVLCGLRKWNLNIYAGCVITAEIQIVLCRIWCPW